MIDLGPEERITSPWLLSFDCGRLPIDRCTVVLLALDPDYLSCQMLQADRSPAFASARAAAVAERPCFRHRTAVIRARLRAGRRAAACDRSCRCQRRA